MSFTTRKKQAQAQASAGLDRAREAAAQVSPIAKDAAARVSPVAKDAAARVRPLAKTAGTAATQGIREARDWATPRIEHGVHEARVWAAPRIEQAGQSISDTVAPKVAGVISDTVAPKVSDVMTATARAIEPAGAAMKRRVWPRVIAGLALLSALGAVIGTVLRKRAARQPDDVMPDDEVQAEADDDTQPARDEVIVEAEVGANGHGPQS